MKITPIQVTIADLKKITKMMEMAVSLAMMIALQFGLSISVSSFIKISSEIQLLTLSEKVDLLMLCTDQRPKTIHMRS